MRWEHYREAGVLCVDCKLTVLGGRGRWGRWWSTSSAADTLRPLLGWLPSCSMGNKLLHSSPQTEEQSMGNYLARSMSGLLEAASAANAESWDSAAQHQAQQAHICYSLVFMQPQLFSAHLYQALVMPLMLDVYCIHRHCLLSLPEHTGLSQIEKNCLCSGLALCRVGDKISLFFTFFSLYGCFSKDLIHLARQIPWTRPLDLFALQTCLIYPVMSGSMSFSPQKAVSCQRALKIVTERSEQSARRQLVCVLFARSPKLSLNEMRQIKKKTTDENFCI